MNDASSVLWRRLKYMLTPQFDIYENLAEKVKGELVLEVGFGTGSGALKLAVYADAVVGYEIDEHAVDFARHAFARGNLVFWCRDILKYESPIQHDAAVMIEVLEHIADWNKALARVVAALRPTGKLYISARNANADLRRNDLHEREWTAAEFRAALAGYFSEVKLYDYTLNNEQGDDSRVTPLVAVATK